MPEPDTASGHFSFFAIFYGNLSHISELSNFELMLAFAPLLSYNLIHACVHSKEENMFGEIISAIALVIMVYLLFQDNSFLVKLIKRSR